VIRLQTYIERELYQNGLWQLNNGNDHMFITCLVVIDAYSKYIVLKLVIKTNCESLIRVLQGIFAFGLPAEKVSDNSPPFCSWLFNSYSNQSNIKITKKLSFHSQSNGLVERVIQTVKKYFKKYI